MSQCEWLRDLFAVSWGWLIVVWICSIMHTAWHWNHCLLGILSQYFLSSVPLWLSSVYVAPPKTPQSRCSNIVRISAWFPRRYFEDFHFPTIEITSSTQTLVGCGPQTLSTIFPKKITQQNFLEFSVLEKKNPHLCSPSKKKWMPRSCPWIASTNG